MLENQITEKVIGAAIEVHRELGPGLLESSYEMCLCHELQLRGLKFKRQVEIPLVYKGVHLNVGYKIDILVEDLVILELKTVESLLPIHDAQLLTYLKLTHKKLGLLLNFNSPLLTKGIKRLINSTPSLSDSAVNHRCK